MVYIRRDANYRSIISEVDYIEGSIVHSLSPAWIRKNNTRTSISVGEGRHVEDRIGMYINHSCNPSCKIDGLNVVAIKSIKVGEEITFDYSSEGELASPFYCNCCDKYIDGKKG